MAVMDKIRGLFRWVALSDVAATELPMTGAVTAEKTTRDDVEIVHTFGFKAVPKPGDSAGEPFGLLAGVGDDSIVAAVVDLRYEPNDVTAGNACMYTATGQRIDLKSGGATANCTVDATGFKKSGTAGKNGTLTITIGAPAPAGVATITVSGGIITSVSGTGACVWADD